MADGSDQTKVVADAALGFSVNVQVDGNRQIAFQTFVSRDGPLGDLNAALDKITKAADRQVAKYMLVSLRKELRQREQAVKDQAEDLARVEAENHKRWDDSGRKGPYKLDAKESAALNNIEISKGKFIADIADIKARIAENEAKIVDTA